MKFIVIFHDFRTFLNDVAVVEFTTFTFTIPRFDAILYVSLTMSLKRLLYVISANRRYWSLYKVVIIDINKNDPILKYVLNTSFLFYDFNTCHHCWQLHNVIFWNVFLTSLNKNGIRFKTFFIMPFNNIKDIFVYLLTTA